MSSRLSPSFEYLDLHITSWIVYKLLVAKFQFESQDQQIHEQWDECIYCCYLAVSPELIWTDSLVVAANKNLFPVLPLILHLSNKGQTKSELVVLLTDQN